MAASTSLLLMGISAASGLCVPGTVGSGASCARLCVAFHPGWAICSCGSPGDDPQLRGCQPIFALPEVMMMGFYCGCPAADAVEVGVMQGFSPGLGCAAPTVDDVVGVVVMCP